MRRAGGRGVSEGTSERTEGTHRYRVEDARDNVYLPQRLAVAYTPEILFTDVTHRHAEKNTTLGHNARCINNTMRCHRSSITRHVLLCLAQFCLEDTDDLGDGLAPSRGALPTSLNQLPQTIGKLRTTPLVPDPDRAGDAHAWKT